MSNRGYFVWIVLMFWAGCSYGQRPFAKMFLNDAGYFEGHGLNVVTLSSKKNAYGNGRANFSFDAGGVAPGISNIPVAIDILNPKDK